MAGTPHPNNGITIGQDGAAPAVAQPSGYRGKIAGAAERAIDSVAGAAGRAGDPRVGQAKDFVRQKPLAVAAVAGVLGLALLNTLRGRGRA